MGNGQGLQPEQQKVGVPALSSDTKNGVKQSDDTDSGCITESFDENGVADSLDTTEQPTSSLDAATPTAR